MNAKDAGGRAERSACLAATPDEPAAVRAIASSACCLLIPSLPLPPSPCPLCMGPGSDFTQENAEV